MLYTAPDPLPSLFVRPSVFIAGGISNCPDWQSDLVAKLDTDLYDVVNPRRNIGFDTTGAIAHEQIVWEHTALGKVDSCVFWFPQETLCPITLFELGSMLERATRNSVRLAIGWHPNYKRAFDLQVQIGLRQVTKQNLLHVGAGWDEFEQAVCAHWAIRAKDRK